MIFTLYLLPVQLNTPMLSSTSHDLNTPTNAMAQSHLDTILLRMTADRRVLVSIVRHLLSETRHESTARRASHAKPRKPMSDEKFLAYREPRTIAEELAEMDGGKRRLEERTHFEGIPLCVIRQAEKAPAVRVIKTTKRILNLEKAMGCLQVNAASVSGSSSHLAPISVAEPPDCRSSGIRKHAGCFGGGA